MTLLLATPAARADLLGVDVSVHQGFVNWTSMKNDGVAFGFVKATEGVDFVDVRFNSNMVNAAAAGVPIGPYHYARPDSFVGALSDPVKQDAINEANDFVDAIQPYYTNSPTAYLRPVLDVEELPASAEINTVFEQKQYLSDWIRDFNSVVQSRLGVDVIIYSNGNYSKNYLEADLASFDLWFAAPNGLNNPPTPASMGIWNEYAFWQYSWTESIGGESPVDANLFQGDEADLAEYYFDASAFTPPTPGDYNGDGVVDAADFTVWADVSPTLDLSQSHPANGNGDLAVNDDDHAYWAANYGRSADDAAAVPEPATTVLTLVAAMSVTALRARRR